MNQSIAKTFGKKMDTYHDTTNDTVVGIASAHHCPPRNVRMVRPDEACNHIFRQGLIFTVIDTVARNVLFSKAGPFQCFFLGWCLELKIGLPTTATAEKEPSFFVFRVWNSNCKCRKGRWAQRSRAHTNEGGKYSTYAVSVARRKLFLRDDLKCTARLISPSTWSTSVPSFLETNDAKRSLVYGTISSFEQVHVFLM